MHFVLCLLPFFHVLIIIFTLPSLSLSKTLQFSAFYKEIQLILRRTEFSPLVRPSTTVPVSHVAPWENDLPTPAPGKDFLGLLDISNFIQLVHEPTLSSGNTLDLIISNGLDVPARERRFCLLCDVRPLSHYV